MSLPESVTVHSVEESKYREDCLFVEVSVTHESINAHLTYEEAEALFGITRADVGKY